MTPPVDHAALIEQLEGWTRDLSYVKHRKGIVERVIAEMRQVAADLTQEDQMQGRAPGRFTVRGTL